MAQQVEFPGFVNSSVGTWVDLAHGLVTYIHEESPDRKTLREWMREKTLWDRETAPGTLALLGVSMSPDPVLQPDGRAFLECSDAEGQKAFLFSRFRGMNLLLAKYALEALDSESGGRLHSTHELFRMLDSYVYPGERISLRSFEDWIRWMTASEGIRQIGIRWGLGTQGQASLKWLQGHDVEEILEEEAEEARELEAEEAPVLEEGTTPRLPVDEGESALADGTGEREAVVDLDLPDMPPAPSAPDGELADAYLKVLEAEGASAEGPDGLRLVSPEGGGAVGAKESLQAGVGRLFGEHEKSSPSPDDGVPRERQSGLHGVDPSAYPADRALFVLRMATIALWMADPARAPRHADFLMHLDDARLFSRLLEGESLDSFLRDQGHFKGQALAIHLSAALVHALAFARRLQDNPSMLDRWENPISPRQRLASIRGELYGGTFELEALWLVAEMERLKLWKSRSSGSEA